MAPRRVAPKEGMKATPKPTNATGKQPAKLKQLERVDRVIKTETENCLWTLGRRVLDWRERAGENGPFDATADP